MAEYIIEELIKRLRLRADVEKFYGGEPMLYDQAADAIEELQQTVEHYKGCSDDWYKEACDYKSMLPRWISVTERLPEEYKDVLCYYEYFRYGDFNCMFRTIDRGYYGNGIWGGEAGQGHKNKVFAWMPLPEPPKE